MKATELDEDQREIFTNHFYSYWPDISNTGVEEDSNRAIPWGCPWYFGWKVILKGETIEEMAENFWFEYKDEIIDLLNAENEKE